MTVEFIGEFLLWSSAINIGLLLWWFLLFTLAHDWLYRFHGRWFRLSVERFDHAHYTGMAFYKIGIFLFNLVPYCALLLASG